MLRLLLFRLWPALIPIILYVLWMRWRNHTARKNGLAEMRLREGPWVIAVLCSMAIGALMLVLVGLEGDKVGTNYQPPRLVDGKIVEGHFDHE
jgi:hypothetical protein